MIKHAKLRRSLEAARKDGPEKEAQFWESFQEGLQEKHLTPTDFSIRELFENFVPNGRELANSFNPNRGGDGFNLLVLEAAGAVSTTDFSNITGQIMYSTVLDAFNSPEFLHPQLVNTIPTQFNGEKIPGIGEIGDQAESIGEGKPYPIAGISEKYIETPATTKRGFIVPVTKEAVFFDRTGLVLDRASAVSRWLGQNKEKRILDVVLGITNPYKYMGTQINTYGDNSGTHDWDNLAASNTLVDWTDIENAELLFDGMTDPHTGEPIVVIPNTIIVPSALKYTAKRIVSATEIRFNDGASNTTQAISGNPVGNYNIVSGPMIKSRTSSATTWFVGDPKRAFAYMENWGIQVIPAPANSEAEFTQDIVARYKVTERGAAAVMEPRYMVKCT